MEFAFDRDEIKCGSTKWIEVKGKFRASYLVSQAIAAMLEIPLDHTYLYTTYEKNALIHVVRQCR